MEKLVFVLVIALLFFLGCSTTLKIKAPIKLSDGTLLNAEVEVVKRPFAKADLAYNPVTGFIIFGADTSTKLVETVKGLEGIMAKAAEMYAKSQNPIGAIAVPKPQATPPPAEIK